MLACLAALMIWHSCYYHALTFEVWGQRLYQSENECLPLCRKCAYKFTTLLSDLEWMKHDWLCYVQLVMNQQGSEGLLQWSSNI